jgi:hypothetical protein
MAPISLSELPASNAAITAIACKMTRRRIDQASTFARGRFGGRGTFFEGPMLRVSAIRIRLGAGQAQDRQRTSLRSDRYLRAWPLPLKRCPLKTIRGCFRIGLPLGDPDSVFTLRKIRDSPAGVLQLVHAGTCVYQWKLSVSRRELVSGYSVVVVPGRGRVSPQGTARRCFPRPLPARSGPRP